MLPSCLQVAAAEAAFGLAQLHATSHTQEPQQLGPQPRPIHTVKVAVAGAVDQFLFNQFMRDFLAECGDSIVHIQGALFMEVRVCMLRMQRCTLCMADVCFAGFLSAANGTVAAEHAFLLCRGFVATSLYSKGMRRRWCLGPLLRGGPRRSSRSTA